MVAINLRNGQILAVGERARSMIGKTPPHIQVTRPLHRGIIADFEVTEKMLRYFIEQAHQEHTVFAPRPRVVIGVPLDVTEVERKAVADAVLSAGAREVFVVEEPIAAAVGIGLPISEAVGNMLIDTGGGTTEIAVISIDGVVTAKSIPIAGDELNRNIIQYARDVFNLLIGERVAEEVKIAAGSAMPQDEPILVPLRGRSPLGLPREIMISDGQIRSAFTFRESVIDTSSPFWRSPAGTCCGYLSPRHRVDGGGALLSGYDRGLKDRFARARVGRSAMPSARRRRIA